MRWGDGSGLIGLVLLSATACAACGGGSQAPRDAGSPDAPAGVDAPAGIDAPATTDAYVCLPHPCYNVIVGGDAGSVLPDPGIIFVETDVEHLVADPQRNVIYASIWEGTVQAISTETGERLWRASVPLGFPPERLAVTDDGSKIYATGDHSTRIMRFDVATKIADLLILVPEAVPDAGVSEIVDIATIPGAPRSLLVAASNRLIVFDDDVPRAGQVAMTNTITRLRFDGPTTAYKLELDGSLATLAVTSTGIQGGATPTVAGLFAPGDNELVFDGELAFGYDGHVVDPRLRTLLGMYGPGPVAVARDANRAYVAPQPVFNIFQIVVDEYDRTAFTLLRTLNLSLKGTATADMVRTTNGTLAFRGTIAVHSGYTGIVLVKPAAWVAALAP